MHFTIIGNDISASKALVDALRALGGDMVYPVTADLIPGDLKEAVELHDLKADALIIPGNSYGDLSAPSDMNVLEALPWVQDTVQQIIRRDFRGELLPGNALMIFVDHDDGSFPHLLYSPLTRIPKRLPPGSDAVYVSIYSAMQAIFKHNRDVDQGERFRDPIQHVVLTTHGRAMGGLDPETLTHQTAMAIRQALVGDYIVDPDDRLAYDHALCYLTP